MEIYGLKRNKSSSFSNELKTENMSRQMNQPNKKGVRKSCKIRWISAIKLIDYSARVIYGYE